MLRSLLGCCISKAPEKELHNEEEDTKVKISKKTSKDKQVAGNIPNSSNSSAGNTNFSLKKGNTKRFEARNEETKKSEEKKGCRSSVGELEEKKSANNKSFKIIEPKPDPKADAEREILEKALKNPETTSKALANPEPPPPEKQEEVKAQQESIIQDISPDIIAAERRLRVEVLEGPVLKPGSTVEINAGGMLHSKRPRKDGHTYFGTEAGHPDYPINDFLVPQEEKGFGKQHFEIKFDLEKRKYFIKDLEDGTGTFIKISPKTILTNNMVVSFGEIHFTVTFSPLIKPEEANHKETKPSIIIKFLEGAKAKQVFNFKPEDPPITIGRKEGSSIHFPTGSLSRNQCKIVFESPNWVIYDGDGSRESTNGTWLFADDYYEIKDSMVFKAAQTLFKITFI